VVIGEGEGTETEPAGGEGEGSRPGASGGEGSRPVVSGGEGTREVGSEGGGMGPVVSEGDSQPDRSLTTQAHDPQSKQGRTPQLRFSQRKPADATSAANVNGASRLQQGCTLQHTCQL